VPFAVRNTHHELGSPHGAKQNNNYVLLQTDSPHGAFNNNH
jgi:hypothetical protein